ncbi:MAG: hypothetical protein ACO2YV_01230 [Pseudomonadales bacterium]
MKEGSEWVFDYVDVSLEDFRLDQRQQKGRAARESVSQRALG